MSRRDYRMLANVIRQNVADKTTREALARALIPALKQDNERFSPEKFIDAAVGE